MAAIYQVTNGVSAWDEDDVNQFARTFSNVLGITADNQDALGRLVLPGAASHPGSPSNGMVSLRTDLGVGGRLHLRHSNSSGVWVPYLPLRQRVQATNIAAFSSSSTSLVDVTNATITFTTTGGFVRLFLIPEGSNYSVSLGTGFGAAVAVLGGEVACIRDATNIGSHAFGCTNDTAHLTSFLLPLGGLIWEEQPSAGAHTYKLQGKVSGAGYSLGVTGRLVAIEYGD